MGSTLVITSGDSEAELLRKAGLEGPILPWRDILTFGPVPGRLGLAKLSAVRAEALTWVGWNDGRDLAQSFAQRDATLAGHGSYDIVTLWFDDDTIDTLQLLQLLDYFNSEKRDLSTLRLIHTDKALHRFSRQQLAALARTSRPVQRQQMNQAVRAWAAFRSTTPELWVELFQFPRLGLKHIWRTIMVTMHTIPAIGSGLGLDEAYVLYRLDAAPRTVRSLLAELAKNSNRDITDWHFLYVVDGLADANEPLIAGRDGSAFRPGMVDPDRYLDSTLSITPLGKAVLCGERDHAAINRIDRWMGGTHITNDNLWRIERSSDRLMAPSA